MLCKQHVVKNIMGQNIYLYICLQSSQWIYLDIFRQWKLLLRSAKGKRDVKGTTCSKIFFQAYNFFEGPQLITDSIIHTHINKLRLFIFVTRGKLKKSFRFVINLCWVRIVKFLTAKSKVKKMSEPSLIFKAK